MPSLAWRALGRGSVLGVLRADLRVARHSVQIVGPWIDHFFADAVVKACPKAVALGVLTRPRTGMAPGFCDQAAAAARCFEARGHLDLRALDTLHAKVVIIDDRIVYCGSMNWYRYSLEKSAEVVLRGPAIPSLLDEVASLCGEAESVTAAAFGTPQSGATLAGQTSEVLDPLAAAKLTEVPGSFILRRKKARRA